MPWSTHTVISPLGLWADMSGKYIRFTIPAESVRDIEDPSEVMRMWDSVVSSILFVCWLNMYHCSCIVVYKYIHTHIHIHTHTYIHTYIHNYITTYRNYIHNYIHPSIHTSIHTYLCTYVRTDVHTYGWTYISLTILSTVALNRLFQPLNLETALNL